jgi:hypothetical protein
MTTSTLSPRPASRCGPDTVWVDEQNEHAQSAGYADFWVCSIWQYNISVVAEAFGVILIVLLSKPLEGQHSAESPHDQSAEHESA